MANHTPEPCPWCGCTEIEISISDICCPLQYSARGRCTECYAEDPGGSGVFDKKEDAESAAWESWNHRPMGNLAAVTAQRDELLGLLGKFFDAYENGTPCYEDPDDFDGYLGDAFVLDEEIFGRICEVLNRHEKSNDKIAGES